MTTSRLPRAVPATAARQILSTLALILVVSPAPARSQARRVDLSDFQRLVSISDPQIAPDGKAIVCVVSRVNWSEDRRERELVLIDVASGTQRPLTYDRKNAGSPRWSSSGDRLAFITTAGSGEKAVPQVFVLDIRGGEARKITDAPSGVQQFAWKPDGTEIAYVTADEPEKKKDADSHNDAFEVGNDGFLTSAAPMPFHIWLVPAAGGTPRRLTSGTWSLGTTEPGDASKPPISWAPDDKSIAFTRQPSPHFGDADSSRLMVLDVASGATRQLTAHKGFEAYGTYAPDGSRIAYWYSRDGDPNNENEIYVTTASGGDGVDLTRPLDRSVLQAVWMPDGRSLLLGGHDGTRTALWLQPLNGPAKRIDLGDLNPTWFYWVDATVGKDGAIAFTATAPGRSTELYYLGSAASPPKGLTDLNAEVASRQLGAVERFEWQGPNGFREDGVLTYPPAFTKGRRYPLVLIIHGGPQAASVRSFSFPSQLVAAHDYIVFQPNYRGSDNLGNAYERAIFNDAGDGPGRDVLAGIAALEKLGIVDTARIAVSGVSYGGYMTAWLIGHSPMWKAAVAVDAVTNKLDQYNLADYNALERYSFGGSPYRGSNMRAYVDQSPITYAAAMKTPTLILSTTGDARVPVSQSYELYHALKDNGVPVKFVAYPVPGHFPADPVRQADAYRRWLEWLDQYLKGPVSTTSPE